MSETAKNVVVVGLEALEAIREIVREELAQLNGGGFRDANPYLSIKDAAPLGGVSPSTIRQKIRQGKLPVCRFGKRVLIKRIDFEQFIESHKTGGSNG